MHGQCIVYMLLDMSLAHLTASTGDMSKLLEINGGEIFLSICMIHLKVTLEVMVLQCIAPYIALCQDVRQEKGTTHL